MASVVPTGVLADMSEICISPADANLRPSSTMFCISRYRVWLGSLYGRVMILSRITPDATSTSRNSPGAMGVSSPLMRSPLVLYPPGRLDSVPASTNWRSMEVALWAKPPTR